MKKIFYFLVTVLVLAALAMPAKATVYGKIKGKVVDKDTGKGIEGATVEFFFKSAWEAAKKEKRGYEPTIFRTKTDKGGYFEIRVAPGEYCVGVRPPSPYLPLFHPFSEPWAPRECAPERQFPLRAGEIKEMELKLEKGGVIEGRIIKPGFEEFKVKDIIFDFFRKEDGFKHRVIIMGPKEDGSFHVGGCPIGGDVYASIDFPFKREGKTLKEMAEIEYYLGKCLDYENEKNIIMDWDKNTKLIARAGKFPPGAKMIGAQGTLIESHIPGLRNALFGLGWQKEVLGKYYNLAPDPSVTKIEFLPPGRYKLETYYYDTSGHKQGVIEFIVNEGETKEITIEPSASQTQ